MPPGVGASLAWEASWSEPPGRGVDRLEVAYQPMNSEGLALGMYPRGNWAAAEKSGNYYRLKDSSVGSRHGGRTWPIAQQADVSRGWMEIQSGALLGNVYAIRFWLVLDGKRVAISESLMLYRDTN